MTPDETTDRSELLCPACVAECEGDDRDEATL
jgi:hypothetical protein